MPDNQNIPNHRVDPPPGGDEDSLREYGRQLAMDSLIEQALGESRTNPHPRKVVPMPLLRRGMKIWLPAVAAVLLAVVGLSLWNPGNPPSTPPSLSTSPGVALDPRWVLLAASGADYRILEPNHVELRRGELRFTSLQPARLVVDTPNATGTAEGTDFLIGHHPSASQTISAKQGLAASKPQTNPDQTMKNPTQITRLLVLAGSVALTTNQGSLAAGPNEAIVAKAGEAPQKLLLEANSSFAFDMYAQLAREKAGENLFFSPYSMSNALLMAAEGARGQTAREMGTVLGFPESLRRNGDDGEMIPWEMGKLRVGQAELNKFMRKDESTTAEQAKLRAEEAALSASLDELRKKLEAAKQTRPDARDKREYSRLRDAKAELARNLADLRDRIDTSKLTITNALWGDQGSSFNEDWKAIVTGTYGTGAVQLADFRHHAGAERLRINDWTTKQTEGLIKDLFPEGSIHSETRLVLVNAIHFKGDWQASFQKSETTRRQFTLGSGAHVEAMMMTKLEDPKSRYAAFHGDGRFFATPGEAKESETSGDGATHLYPGKDGFAMAELPYRGRKLSMVVIAPNDPAGLPALEARLNSANLGQWLKSLRSRPINVHLPKFKLEAEYPNLGGESGTLAAMGMPTAFSKAADFSGMTSAERLFLETVVHKAVIDVNEEGTEAAAATGLALKLLEADPTVPFVPTFRADRPFVFLIRDRESGAILFLGRMLNPAGLAD